MQQDASQTQTTKEKKKGFTVLKEKFGHFEAYELII